MSALCPSFFHGSLICASLTRASLTRAAVACALAAMAATTPALAQSYTIGFENAVGIPNQPSPSTANAAAAFSDAFGGSDTIQGVTFSDNFTVFRSSYTNAVGGDDLYGATDGSFALTNIVNPPGAGTTAPDTGPGDPGPDALTLNTSDVLTSVYFGIVDYGNGSYGADQVTVTALGIGGADLGPGITLALDTSGAPTLTRLDTSAFLAYAGQISGYRIDRDAGPYYAAFGGGGNYVADDFTFTPAAAPEPCAATVFGVAGLCVLLRRAAQRPGATGKKV